MWSGSKRDISYDDGRDRGDDGHTEGMSDGAAGSRDGRRDTVIFFIDTGHNGVGIWRRKEGKSDADHHESGDEKRERILFSYKDQSEDACR